MEENYMYRDGEIGHPLYASLRSDCECNENA